MLAAPTVRAGVPLAPPMAAGEVLQASVAELPAAICLGFVSGGGDYGGEGRGAYGSVDAGVDEVLEGGFDGVGALGEAEGEGGDGADEGAAAALGVVLVGDVVEAGEELSKRRC